MSSWASTSSMSSCRVTDLLRQFLVMSMMAAIIRESGIKEGAPSAETFWPSCLGTLEHFLSLTMDGEARLVSEARPMSMGKAAAAVETFWLSCFGRVEHFLSLTMDGEARLVSEAGPLTIGKAAPAAETFWLSCFGRVEHFLSLTTEARPLSIGEAGPAAAAPRIGSSLSLGSAVPELKNIF